MTTRNITFLVGDPNLNLHLPLLLGRGVVPKLYYTFWNLIISTVTPWSTLLHGCNRALPRLDDLKRKHKNKREWKLSYSNRGDKPNHAEKTMNHNSRLPVGLHPSEVLCGDEPRVKLLSAVKASRHGKRTRRMPNRGREKKREAKCFKVHALCISLIWTWSGFSSLLYVLYVFSIVFICFYVYCVCICQFLELSSLSIIFLYPESLDDALSTILSLFTNLSREFHTNIRRTSIFGTSK